VRRNRSLTRETDKTVYALHAHAPGQNLPRHFFAGSACRDFEQQTGFGRWIERCEMEAVPSSFLTCMREGYSGFPIAVHRSYDLSLRLDYSIFGIGVDRKHKAKWLFPQEKAIFHGS
jgi:hypothetical protein